MVGLHEGNYVNKSPEAAYLGAVQCMSTATQQPARVTEERQRHNRNSKRAQFTHVRAIH